MKPQRKEFEQVKTDEWLTGKIIDIQYDQEHEFVYKGNKTISPGVRIIFNLDGYKEKKYSRWMYFNYGNKSNLYKLFVSTLIEGAYPNMDLDLDSLKGLPIKVMYAQNGEYQNLVMVRPNKGKVAVAGSLAESVEVEEDAPPF